MDRRPVRAARAAGRRLHPAVALLREALELVVRLDALEREHHRGRPHVDLLPDRVPRAVVGRGPARRVAGDVADDAVVRLDGLLQTAVHLGLAPVLHALVLDPLVVADRHAAGVADDVGDQLDAALGQDAIAFRRGGAVRSFRDQLALEPLGHRPRDLPAQRGRDADVGLHVPQVRLGDLLRFRISPHGAAEVARVLVHVRDQVLHVDAGWIEDGPARVVHRQELRSQGAEDLGRVRTHVAEALQDERAPGRRGAALREPLLDAVGEALPGGPYAAFRAADARVLARDDAAQLVTLALAVGVLPEQESHDGAVGADVGGRDVEVGADRSEER